MASSQGKSELKFADWMATLPDSIHSIPLTNLAIPENANGNEKEQFYLEKLDVYMVLISVFLCLLSLVFNVFPYNDLFLLPVFLEPAVFFLFLVTYYFCFDWDETIYRTYLGLGLIVQISFKKQVFFPIILGW